MLTTKNLVIAGDGGVHTNAAGRRVALLRAYDKLTGEDAGGVEMPNRQTGSPMSYQIDGQTVHRPGRQRQRRCGAAGVRASVHSMIVGRLASRTDAEQPVNS